jgi:GT2 family glycosyltransferase
MGARTLRVEHRKISAVRNAGARAACGEVFFFVDADTQVNERAVSAALAVLRAGAAGGGCVFDFDGPTPLWGRIILFFAVLAARLIRWVGGCCLFCTREAYRATGGFSESLYAGEDIAFVQALKKVGGFVVLKPKVISSGRKLNVVGPWHVLGLMVTIAIRGARYESKWVRDILYGRRAQECRRPPDAG